MHKIHGKPLKSHISESKTASFNPFSYELTRIYISIICVEKTAMLILMHGKW